MKEKLSEHLNAALRSLLDEAGSEVVAGGCIRGEIYLATCLSAVADPCPEIVQLLQKVGLVIPAVEIPQIDRIIRTQIRGHQIFHIRDCHIQLKQFLCHGEPPHGSNVQSPMSPRARRGFNKSEIRISKFEMSRVVG
jgi:hypothetical protein